MKNTVFEALSSFEQVNSLANKKAVRSVIHRFLAKHWGGEAPKSSKATFDETNALTDLLKTLPATILIDTMFLLEQEFVKKEVPKENSKSYRYAYKGFLTWAETNGYFKNVQQESTIPIEKSDLFSKFKNSKNQSRFVSHGRIQKTPYILMATHNGNGKTKGELIYPNDYVNLNLQEELKVFKLFREEVFNVSKETLNRNIIVIYQFLGWLHRYKNIPLEKLSLTSIIYFTKLNVLIKDFKNKQGKVNYQKFTLQKAVARQEGIDLSNENMDLIKEYINFVAGHPRTRLVAMTALIAVAKFVFRDEVGTDEYIDDTELPIVKRLNQLTNTISKSLQSIPDVIPHEYKSISWYEAISVLEILRKRFHCLFTISISKLGYSQSKKRETQAIMNDLQLFLSLSLMLLIPTDRARTYFELEIGKTFVYGLHVDNRFVPVEKLTDKNEAIWYIHLLPDDYKTGKHYKEYWGVIPNVIFEDGQKLYDYVDTWINQGRDCQQKCNHKYFFRGINNYLPLNGCAWTSRIKNIFVNETNIPVTPKEIRKMYITHINNQGATNAELKGAAMAMHHSQRMQESVYNSQTVFDRVAPIMELNERMWREAFGSSQSD